MYREDCFHISVNFQHLTQSLVNITHWLTQIFPAVSGHQNKTVASGKNFIKLSISKFIICFYRCLQSIDNSVTSYHNSFRIDIFLQQIFLTGRCRRKVHIRNGTCQLAVHFFRIRRILVACSETCFHVTNRNLRIKSSQSSGKSCSRITMNKYHIRLRILNYFFQAI